MTMLTVDDLARDLKVRNEDLLRELLTMGYEVEGPESPLETDDPAALRAQLVTALPHLEVVEKRIKPTVIRRRVKKDLEAVGKEEGPAESLAEAVAEPAAEAQEKAPAEAKSEAEVKEPHKKPVKKVKKPEAARIIEMAPKPAAPRKPVGGPVPPRSSRLLQLLQNSRKPKKSQE